MSNNWGRLSFEKRQEKINEPVVQELFATMPDKVVAAIERGFLSEEFDFDGDDAKIILNYLTYESFISRAINLQAGSGVAYYYIYNGYMFSPVDRYFCKCLAGAQTRKRLTEIQSNVAVFLRKHFGHQDSIVIYNVGSAQGYDLIKVLYDNPDLAEKCLVYNIDPDEVSLAQGWERIVSLGLEKCFVLVPHELKEVERKSVDFIVASGIFCPLSMRQSNIVMPRMLKPHLRDGGAIMYNATTQYMYEGDPVCDFLMRIGSWSMDYKSVEDILSIADNAKMEHLGHFSDDLNYNLCVFARK